MKNPYQKTIYACFTAYIVQAVVNNFVPLLFLTFQSSYHIPLSRITLLVTFNFGLQLLVDLASVGFVDRIGYRASMVLAHALAAAGLALLAILPEILPNPFLGILLSVMVYAVGGGLIEVVVSPVVEACPSNHKEQAMSLLHSFYCWGHVAVVLLSTVFFALFGTGHWRVLALVWALVPLGNLFAFLRVPIPALLEEGQRGMTIGELARNRMFWVFLLMMLCAGASEQGVSQWASTFAEKGLGVGKTVGDLAGPRPESLQRNIITGGGVGHRHAHLLGHLSDEVQRPRLLWGHRHQLHQPLRSLHQAAEHGRVRRVEPLSVLRPFFRQGQEGTL